MSFNADKKREHEAAAEAALCEKHFGKAFFHTAKAAEFGLKLAEQSEGKVAEQYVEDAYELLDIAEQLKEKARAQSREGLQRAKEKAGPDEDVSQSQWELKERQREKLIDVAGLEDVKVELREKVIEPFLHPEVHERFRLRKGGGVLMYGPPGNGKTYIAKAIAGELDAAFFNVNASQVKDKYVGETEKNMQRLFDEARKHDRAVIFLDEVDAILARRGNRKIGMVTQFLTLTDGLVETKNCLLVLAATNKPWLLDPAVLRPGRLGDHIYVGPPDAPAREAIVRLNMEGVPVADDVDYAAIAARTDRFSGADMASLCDRAKRSAKNRQLASGQDEDVTQEDFEAALGKVRPSVTPEHLAEFDAWRAGHAASSDDYGDD